MRRNTKLQHRSIFSEARFRALKVLCTAALPVSLRELVYRSGLGLSSVQAAVKSLLRLHYIKRSELASRVYFERNPEHPDWPVLEELFLHEEQRAIAESVSKVNPAGKVMEALDDLWLFSDRIREACHAVERCARKSRQTA